MAGGDTRRGSPSGPKAMTKAQLAFAAGTLTSQAVKVITQTLAGARITDRLVVNSAAALPAGTAVVGGRVSAAGVATVYLLNPTIADIAGGNMTLDCVVLNFTT